jgi:hypothetical protein
VRKATLASLLARTAPGLRLNEHLDHDDRQLVFGHPCRLGLESRSGAIRFYSSSRSPQRSDL